MPRTERLLLRQWRDSDRAPFAALNGDPEVMRFFPGTMDRAQSDAAVDRYRERIDSTGYGIWAVEVTATGEFVGFVGLNQPRWTAHFTSPESPATEVGWRLAQSAWGIGYATEAARAALAVAFGRAGLAEVVALTTVANRRSRAVMERLGMRHDPGDDFDHPTIVEGSPVRPQVLYRLPRSAWAGRSDPQAGSARE